MVKVEGYEMMQCLKEVFDVVWRCGKMPEERRVAMIVPIRKGLYAA